MVTNINNPESSKGGARGGISIFSAKVKYIILDGSEEGEANNLVSAEKWGSYDAVGTIFYNNISTNVDQFTTDIDNFNIEELDSWDGTAKPLFSFQKYYPLINEVVLIITTTSKDYLEDRRATQQYYLPVVNLWNHPHHNTLPASQNYTEDKSEIFSSENYEQAGLLRRVLDGELDIDIPLGKYFKEQLNIHPLLPYEGDHIVEGRFGNSIRLGSTARSEKISEQNKNYWSNGAKGENGDPITIIKNGQSVALDNQGWIHATEDVNLDPSSIYLTSNQKIDNFIVASDAWNTFGINASIPQNDQNEATKLLDKPAEFIQDKEIETEKVEKPKDNQEEVNKGQQDKSQQEEPIEQQETGSIDYEKQDQEVSGSLTTSGSLDTQTSGSISEEEAGLEDDDTTEYYQLDDGQTELEAIERPPLPESYAVASDQMQPYNNCGNCKFQENNQCSKWGAKVRAKHENPWWCTSYAEIIEFAWNKLPNSTRRGRGGSTASIYTAYFGHNYTTYYYFVQSTEEGFGYLDENRNGQDAKKEADAASGIPSKVFPFKNGGSKGWIGFNEAEGKTIEEASPDIMPGVSKFNKLGTESDLINLFYQMMNWGKYGSDKSTWPYTLLNSQIFDPEENYSRPLYVEVSIKTKDYEKDKAAGRQLLLNKAKEAFIKKLHKMEKELKTDFKITLNEGSSKLISGDGINGKKSRLKTSFKIINLVDTYSG